MSQFDIWKVYLGANGEATMQLYAHLDTLGPAGLVGKNLFRAHKASARAKAYRGGWKGVAYRKKQWSLGLLVDCLLEHGPGLGITFGWKEDPAQEFYPWVLYIELPTGQASFHMPERGKGPDFAGEWDGLKDSASHIVKYIDQVITAAEVTA